jgi:glycosyltransferase involved in cell wall biosynthesis
MSHLQREQHIARRCELAQDTRPLLTVIVPAHNEEATIDDLLHAVLLVPYDKHVIVVDDGSTDATYEIAACWAKRHSCCEVLRHTARLGKGVAIRTALAHARGQYAIIQDADLEYDPADYPQLLEPLIAGQAQVVYGSRYLAPMIEGKPLRTFRWGVSALNVAVQALYGARLTDQMTCYKAFPTALLRAMDLRCERFEFCAEVTAKVCRMGLEILEVPIRYRPRSMPDGKKIRWRDGWESLRTLWRLRHWKPRDGESCDRSPGADPAHRSVQAAESCRS